MREAHWDMSQSPPKYKPRYASTCYFNKNPFHHEIEMSWRLIGFHVMVLTNSESNSQ